MSTPSPGFDISLSLITPLPPCLSPFPPVLPPTFFFFYFAIEFANSIRSPLATSNPKLRWDFFAPPGKPLQSSVELMFPSPRCWMHRVSLPFLQGLVNSHSVSSLVLHPFPECFGWSVLCSPFEMCCEVSHLCLNYVWWSKDLLQF